MNALAQYIQTLAPQLSAWRRDFHHFAESGWVEFRTAAKVAEILASLGYALAMGGNPGARVCPRAGARRA